MLSRRFGDLSLIGLFIAVLTLAVVVGVSYVSGGILFSPGKLSNNTSGISLNGLQSHSELQGTCAACHPPPWGAETMDDRCKNCHTTIEAQLLDDLSLHSILFEDKVPLACKDCHPDHRGTDASLTQLEPTRFPHNAIGYSLNAHQTLSNGNPFTCADCHTNEITKFNENSCTICHQEIDATFTRTHINTFSSQCLSCHDGVDTYGKDFDHNKMIFNLEGKHATISCSNCHLGAQSPSDLLATPQACVDCHVEDDDHEGEFGTDCGECHSSTSWEDATFDHSLSTFPLEGKHSDVKCSDCHNNGVYKGTQQECIDCHIDDDKHEGTYGLDCGECHISANWQEALFDHSLSMFPLEDKHIEVDCSECHVDDVFKGTPQECVDCHVEDDDHEGEFGTDCGECHSSTSWEDATFDHSLSTFPLEGKHSDVKCSDCHNNGVYKGTQQECVSCHEDPVYHEVSFSSDCASCHTSDYWSPAEYTERHIFPMDHESNNNKDCQTCHVISLDIYTCYECHEHTPGNIRSEHREERIFDYEDCMECHPTGREPDEKDDD